VDCGLWTVDCGLWTVDCGLWTVVRGRGIIFGKNILFSSRSMPRHDAKSSRPPEGRNRGETSSNDNSIEHQIYNSSNEEFRGLIEMLIVSRP
jgi:hypothetical protein